MFMARVPMGGPSSEIEARRLMEESLSHAPSMEQLMELSGTPSRSPKTLLEVVSRRLLTQDKQNVHSLLHT